MYFYVISINKNWCSFYGAKEILGKCHLREGSTGMETERAQTQKTPKISCRRTFRPLQLIASISIRLSPHPFKDEDLSLSKLLKVNKINIESNNSSNEKLDAKSMTIYKWEYKTGIADKLGNNYYTII